RRMISHFGQTRAAILTNMVEKFGSLLPRLAGAGAGYQLTNYFFLLASSYLLSGSVKAFDATFQINDENRKIHGVESLSPLNRRLLNRSVHALLFFVVELAVGNVGSDDELGSALSKH